MTIKLAVTDACIFIDLYDTGLITQFFSLHIEIHTTAAVFHELFPAQQAMLESFLPARKLIIHNLAEQDFIQIQNTAYPKALSETDKSVLHIANHLKAGILSSDKAVRNFAKSKGIEYHGMLWILDELVAAAIITPAGAAHKLQLLVAANFIFRTSKPLTDEIAGRLKRWQP